VSFSNSWVDCVNRWKLRGSSEVSPLFFSFFLFFFFIFLVDPWNFLCNRESGNQGLNSGYPKLKTKVP
jgi:hypothetical protein